MYPQIQGRLYRTVPREEGRDESPGGMKHVRGKLASSLSHLRVWVALSPIGAVFIPPLDSLKIGENVSTKPPTDLSRGSKKLKIQQCFF